MSNNSVQNDTFMPFVRPAISEAEIEAVTECLRSGWLATGPKVQAFEANLAAYCEAPFVSVMTSGTAVLHLICQALLQPGDEVITTPMTFISTVNSIVLAGAKPVFVDVNLSDYNIDVTQIEQAITPRTKAIMPVHFAGLPVDLDPIYALAEKYGLRVIEDAAHAIGATYKNRKIGSFGDTQMFSFHPNKNMTSGEGGAMITRDENLLQQVNILRFHGIDRAAWNRFSKSGSQQYDVVAPGFKYNMMDIQAAIGIIQLGKLDGFNQQRARLAERYFGLLRGLPEWTLPTLPNYAHEHAWHMFNPLINPEVCGITRDEFIEKMKEHNIGVGYHYQSIHTFSFYQKTFHYQDSDFPNALSIGQRIVSLPLFSEMTENEQDRVVEAMHAVCAGG